MTASDEQRVFEQELFRGLDQDGGYSPEIRQIAEMIIGDSKFAADIRGLGLEVTTFNKRGGQWCFRLLAQADLNGNRLKKAFSGECQFEPLVVSRVTLRPDCTVRSPAKRASAWPNLARWALVVGLVLLLFIAAGFAAVVLSLDWALGGDTASLTQILVLAAAIGWLGSCGAALRSFIDRYRNGFEFDDDDGRRVQWPERLDRTERFSSLMAPTFLLRPALGATIAPIAYFTLRLGAAGIFAENVATEARSGQLVGVLAIAGLAGMFSKSIWDNLNERTQNLFKP